MMRYRRLILIGAGLAAVALAQTSRESYRVPYQTWRQVAPALETDASAPTATFADEVRTSAQAAEAFFSARTAYMPLAQPSAADQTAWASKPLATAETLLATPQNVEQLLTLRATRVGNEINVFKADDKDPAIRRIRQAMERERAALRALMDTLTARKASLTELIDRSDEAEIERASTFQTLNAANGRRTQLAEHVKREATDWAKYYTHLLEGSTSGARTLTTAVTSGVAPAAGAPTPSPAKIVRPAANGQVPITRYTGEWVFPNKGLFYGPQPESVEMTIQESSGRISGTLSAKFLMPARTVKFNFQGPVVQQGKTQTFPLQTGDSVAGSVELIPGSAINLLEVNFQADTTTGNFILVKR